MMNTVTVRDEATATEEWLGNLDTSTVTFRDASHVREIIAAQEARDAADKRLRDAVAAARAAGDSWTVIGAALGVSKQAAQERFGKVTARATPAARVVPTGARGWEIERGGTFVEKVATKTLAISRASEIVKDQGGGDFTVSNRDGSVHTYQVRRYKTRRV